MYVYQNILSIKNNMSCSGILMYVKVDFDHTYSSRYYSLLSYCFFPQLCLPTYHVHVLFPNKCHQALIIGPGCLINDSVTEDCDCPSSSAIICLQTLESKACNLFSPHLRQLAAESSQFSALSLYTIYFIHPPYLYRGMTGKSLAHGRVKPITFM